MSDKENEENAKKVIEAIQSDLDRGFIIINEKGDELTSVLAVLGSLKKGEEVSVIDPDELDALVSTAEGVEDFEVVNTNWRNESMLLN